MRNLLYDAMEFENTFCEISRTAYFTNSCLGIPYFHNRRLGLQEIHMLPYRRFLKKVFRKCMWLKTGFLRKFSRNSRYDRIEDLYTTYMRFRRQYKVMSHTYYVINLCHFSNRFFMSHVIRRIAQSQVNISEEKFVVTCAVSLTENVLRKFCNKEMKLWKSNEFFMNHPLSDTLGKGKLTWEGRKITILTKNIYGTNSIIESMWQVEKIYFVAKSDEYIGIMKNKNRKIEKF